MNDKNIPLAEKIGRIILFPLSMMERSMQRRRDEAEQQKQRLEREARQREYDRKTEIEHKRQREEFEKQESQKLVAQKTKLDRDSILFDVRLLYDRHAGDIRDSFPVERFEQYFEDFFPLGLDVEVLSQRAKRLEEMILSFFAEEAAPEKSTSLLEIDEEYDRRKREIDACGQDQDTKDSLLARLEKWRAKTMREQTSF